jgi:GNAT superfamily N-acetyltransferase
MKAVGYRISRWYPTREEAEALDLTCFPYDERWWQQDAVWWRVMTSEGEVAGYAAARPWKPDHAVYLARVGVLPAHRGKGLQRRLIRVRIRWAKQNGYRMVYTYTLPSNPASSINLIREGMVPFWPSIPWGGEAACYWIKRF